MKKVFKFVKGKRDEKKEGGGITPSQSSDLTSPAQTPEDERFLGLDSSSGYIVDFCGKDKTLTKLHKAAWQGNLDKLKSALKKFEIDAVDRHNRSALHFAVVQGHPNIVWFLLGNNAKMTICDDDGRTPLLKAIECAHKECMTLLLERGAEVNNTDYSGNTGLHIAAKLGSLDITSALLKRDADFEISNNCGEYPLHIATRSQNKDMVELLLRCGASVNVFDRENRTPLMLAAKTGNLILAKVFFEYGAQLTVVDSNGWTAEDYALLGGHQNVATELKSLLKKSGAKSEGPMLETHNEEDEDLAKSAENSDTWNDSQTSNGNEPKDMLTKKLHQFFKKCSDEGLDSEKDKDDDLQESPGSGIVPPPCQPPRSWEIIQAGMIDENIEGSEPKRRSIMTLGTLHSRRESFTENLANNPQNETARYTLSLNRRKDAKKGESFAKQRLSFNEEESLKSWIVEDSISDKHETGRLADVSEQKSKEKIPGTKKPSSTESDWDSDFSLSLDSGSKADVNGVRDNADEVANSSKTNNKKEKYPSKPVPVDVITTSSDSTESVKRKPKPILVDGTLGRSDTLQGVEEIWVANPSLKENKGVKKIENESKESKDGSSSWDSVTSSEKDNIEVTFPPPPTELELGVDIAKSMSFIKGVSIDHPPGSMLERNVWKTAYESQSHSLDCLDEKERGSLSHLEKFTEKSGKRHSRHQSISTQKWRSEELPQCQRPVDRLVDVNRRINEQLECYDQALRELAESTYAKKQDALISTLTSDKSSKAQNYYSLPASKFKGGVTVAKQSKAEKFSLAPLDIEPNFSISKSGSQFISNNNYYYDKPPFGSKPFIEMGSGPVSLPFFVNDDDDDRLKLNARQKIDEIENNESLGAEKLSKPDSKPNIRRTESENCPNENKSKVSRSASLNLKSQTRLPDFRVDEKDEAMAAMKATKPTTLSFKAKEEMPEEMENMESPASDDLSGSGTGSEKGEKRSKRHMLLAMRDVKHAVQVTSSFKSSIDDQILSPLTKTSDNFELDDKKLSPKGASSSSEGASPGDEYPFFRTDSKVGPLGRQETVIERSEFRRRSSSSGTGEEPTLWLQDEAIQKQGQPESQSDDDVPELDHEKTNVKHERISSFSPLGAVYREIQAEGKRSKRGKEKNVNIKSASSSSSEHSSSSTPTDKELVNITFTIPDDNGEAALKRLERLGSSSSEGASSRRDIEEDQGGDDDPDGDEGGSPDVSLSSGPIEPLGPSKGDSGSDADSTQNDVTPTHNYSLKNHHEWLKNHLRTATNEKSKLEQLAAQLTEKAERLQYELADAKEAAKSRDEVIVLLQGQLARMETAYTRSLEESVHSRLQLTSHEQEILHLKELCYKFEEERDHVVTEVTEGQCCELNKHIKSLKEERDRMKKEMLRLEQEKSALEKRLKEATATDLIDECQRWKERCEDLEKSVEENDKKQSNYETYISTLNQEHSEKEKELQAINLEQDQKIALIMEKSIGLEAQVHSLTSEVASSRRKGEISEELNDSVAELKKKNEELEGLLIKLQKELEARDLKKVMDKEDAIENLVQQFNNERESLILSYEKRLAERSSNQSDTEMFEIKKENEKLKRIIQENQEELTIQRFQLGENNESLRNEMSLLREQCHVGTKSIADVQSKDKQELDTLMKENLNLKKETSELKIRLMKDEDDVPNFKVELLEQVSENTNIKSQIFELRNQIKSLNETLIGERELLLDYKVKNANLEQQVRKLSTDAKQNMNTVRISKKREVGKEDEMAWTNLYGIKQAGKMREAWDAKCGGAGFNLQERDGLYEKVSHSSLPRRLRSASNGDDDSSVEKLKSELDKTKEELILQKIETTLMVDNESVIRQTSELLELKKQLISLQNRMVDEKSLRYALENRIAEITLDLKDKNKLELEVNFLRRKINRDFVPKTNVELLKYRNDLESKRQKILDVGLDEQSKARCEELAKERERCQELRRKMGRKCNSMEQPLESGSSRAQFHSYPRATTTTFVPATLEHQLKARLDDELDRSIRKHLSDNAAHH